MTRRTVTTSVATGLRAAHRLSNRPKYSNRRHRGILCFEYFQDYLWKLHFYKNREHCEPQLWSQYYIRCNPWQYANDLCNTVHFKGRRNQPSLSRPLWQHNHGRSTENTQANVPLWLPMSCMHPWLSPCREIAKNIHVVRVKIWRLPPAPPVDFATDRCWKNAWSHEPRTVR